MTKKNKEKALAFAKRMQDIANDMNIDANQAYIDGLFISSDLSYNLRQPDTMLCILKTCLSVDKDGNRITFDEKLNEIKEDFGEDSEMFLLAKAIVEVERNFDIS